MIRLEVRGGGGEVSPEPGRVQPDGLQGLLHRPLSAGRVMSAEELLDLLSACFRRKILSSRLHQPSQQEAALIMIQIIYLVVLDF